MVDERLQWFPKGQPVMFEGAEYGDGVEFDSGFFYCCDETPAKHPEPSAIDIGLTVSSVLDIATVDPGSEPSYAGMTENQRRGYLGWLADGRRGHTYEQRSLGYVYLALCGFERRVLLEGDTDSAIVNEAIEILKHYEHMAGASPVCSQLTEFIHFAGLKLGAERYRTFWPGLLQRETHQLQENDLKFILANLADLDEPLDCTLAYRMAMLHADTDAESDPLQVSATMEFQELFHKHYFEAYPSGFT